MFDGTTKVKNKHSAIAKIKPSVLIPFTHLKSSIINETIKKINEVILILFKQKIKPEDTFLLQLLKYF